MIYLHLQKKDPSGWSRVEVHRLAGDHLEPVGAVAPLSPEESHVFSGAMVRGELPDAFSSRPAHRVVRGRMYRVSTVTAHLAGMPLD